MKNIIAIILAVTLTFFAAMPAWAQTPEKDEARRALASTMANLVISILRDQKKSDTDRKISLEQGFANIVDTQWIARFVLGNAWRQATDEQREQYTKLYRAYLTKLYVANYAENTQRRIRDIEVLDVNGVSDDKYSVRTQIVFTTQENMRVDYMVRENDNTRKIVDVVIEGISLLTAHRSEFSTLAAREGMDGVITRLQRLVKEPMPGISMSML